MSMPIVFTLASIKRPEIGKITILEYQFYISVAKPLPVTSLILAQLSCIAILIGIKKLKSIAILNTIWVMFEKMLQYRRDHHQLLL
jgi:hypothetical protein